MSDRRHPARRAWSSASATSVAVNGIDLHVPPGEFFTMLGPSGCGKTTTLRLIAGFERPTEGEILLDGDDMSRTPPHKRRVNTVFQSYALFPHKIGRRERRLRPALPARHQGGGQAPRATRRWRWCAWRASAHAAPDAALRRPAAARRAGARARARAARAAARRAARRARRAPAPRPAGRAQAHPGAARGHLHLRHPRPGRGADDERPRRGHARRATSSSAASRARSTRRPRRRSWPTSSARRTSCRWRWATPTATARSSAWAPSRCAPRRARCRRATTRWR